MLTIKTSFSSVNYKYLDAKNVTVLKNVLLYKKKCYFLGGNGVYPPCIP